MRFVTRWSGRPELLDALFASAAGLFVAVASVFAHAGQSGVRQLDAAGYLLIGLAVAGLAVRRRRPALCLLLALGSTLAFLALHYPYGPVFLLTAIAMYSVAAWQSIRYAAAAAALAALVHLPWGLLVEKDPEGPLTTLLTLAAWLAAPVALGIAVRARREARARAALEDRSRGAYEERLRIAQEVHDVVGHALAVISMNAGAALYVLGKQRAGTPEQVDEALRAIRGVSNGALDELRVTLATFAESGARTRSGPAVGGGSPVTAERRLSPGLDLVPELVAATHVDGLAITLVVRGGSGDDLPPAVDLVGYRIVQEALANVVRHAGARSAVVVVDHQPQQVALTVTDDGHGGPRANPGGTGLNSMRARAATLGGTLTAGPVSDTDATTGWAVHAVLPYAVRKAGEPATTTARHDHAGQ
jgi:signal transduction histidine kinase